MKSWFLILMLFGFTHGVKAQTVKLKRGLCKVTEVIKDKKLPAGKTKVTISFVGPDNKPVKSNVKFVYNNDSLFPKINSEGKYSISLAPGKYKLRFAVPYWYEVVSDSITFHNQSLMSVLVKFQPKDF
ncbi:MAG: hypothetical protein H0W61_04585 [Bacteroidetes bacterium]|nr:hypothetical protein [Bacteroidota bacterium]